MKPAEHAQHILELIHMDMCGPMQTPSIGGSRYFITFTDNVSKKTWIYFLKSKDQVYTKFRQFHALVTNKSGMTMKKLHSDNGGEYVDSQLQKFLAN